MSRLQSVPALGHVVVAFLRVGWLDARTYPVAFILGRIGLLGALAVFAVIGGLITEDPGEYLGFLVVGLVCAEVMDAAAQGVGNRLTEEINTGRFETYFVEPIPLPMVPLGLVQFELLSRVGTAGLVVLVSLPLGADYVVSWRVWPAIGVVVLGVLAVLGIALAGAALRVLTKRSDPLLAVYSLAARFFGGVFFPVAALPDWLEPVAIVVPHSYVTSTVRRLVLAPTDLAERHVATGTTALVLVAMAVLTIPLGLWLFRRAVSYGRRLGLLSGY